MVKTEPNNQADRYISEQSKNALELYKLDKRYKFITGAVLLLIALVLLLMLVFVDIPLATQQALIVIVGILLFAALDALRRCLEDTKSSPMLTFNDNRSYQGDTVHNTYNEVYNTYNQKQNLAEAAEEIQELLEQLEKTHPTNTEEEKRKVVIEAVEEIEHKPELKSRVISALKFGGIDAFEEAVNHPLVNILVATIEGWQEVNSGKNDREIKED